MRLLNRTIASSPDQAGALRVAAEIVLERSGAVLNPWFDVPEDCADQISRTGNPWLVYMLPIAMAAGEDIALPLGVDPHLTENLSGMMRLWHAWYPELRPAEIDAPEATVSERRDDRRGLFFSGGADSLFSLLRHDHETTGCGSGPVDDLIFVAGLDIPLNATAELEAAHRRLATIANRHDKHLLRVATNLKIPGTPYHDRWILSHGCALGTVAHLFEGRLGEVVIGSTHSYSRLLPIGSHPLTDPLLSSRRLRIVHDGASSTRIEKLGLVGEHQEALDVLRVCWEGKRHDNCSRCNKCLTTMTVLDLLGFRDSASCFNWSSYSPSDIRYMALEAESEINQVKDLAAAAQSRGRNDIADSARLCLESAMRRRSVVEFTRRMPFFWRFDYQVGQMLRNSRPAEPPGRRA